MIVDGQEIPTRFTYDPSGKRGDRWTRVLSRFLAGGDPTPTTAQVENFALKLLEGDAVGDAALGALSDFDRAEGQALIDRGIRGGLEAIPDAPPELRRLFREIETMPVWVNPALVELGQAVCRRIGYGGLFVLRDLALMGGYQNSAITKPLVFTGALEGGAASRLGETSSFWVDVTRKGGLDRDGAGFESAVRVRILHTVLRRRILATPGWDTKAWGLPINQADMIATNLAFSSVFLMGLRALGFRFTGREARAVMHLWRYIGHLMGIDSAELPTDEQQAARIIYLVSSTQPPPDEDSRQLAAALRDEPETLARTIVERQLAPLSIAMHSGVSRFFLGRQVSDALGLPDTRWKWLPVVAAPPVYALETARRVLPFGTRIAERAGAWTQERGLERRVRGAPVAYQPVEELVAERARSVNESA